MSGGRVVQYYMKHDRGGFMGTAIQTVESRAAQNNEIFVNKKETGLIKTYSSHTHTCTPYSHIPPSLQICFIVKSRDD